MTERKYSPDTQMVGFRTTAERRKLEAARKNRNVVKAGECQFCGVKIGPAAIERIVERFGVLACGNCQLAFTKPYQSGYLQATTRALEAREMGGQDL